MEDQTSLLPGSMQEDPFKVVTRGYNKRQVDDYVVQCQHHIRDLSQRLALAEQEVERVRRDAASALDRVAAKPVHEEVSERLAQILRLANEEAERERAEAADEIASLREQTLVETQALREQALAESEHLRRQATEDTEALRDEAETETQALRARVDAEVAELHLRAEEQAADAVERASAEAERLLAEARETSERDLTAAHAEALELAERVRSESEQLMLATQERAHALLGDAEQRATAVNSVLGGRLELLTTTHSQVLAHLVDLREVLIDVLDREEAAGPFAVVPSVEPEPEFAAEDLYVQTAGEVVAEYEASPEAAVTAWGETPASRPLDVDDEESAVDVVSVETIDVDVDVDDAEPAPVGAGTAWRRGPRA